jgi:hypothetical protein
MEALHQTRRGLVALYRSMALVFENLGAPLPAQLRIAVGFTSSGRCSRRLAECWDNQCPDR